MLLRCLSEISFFLTNRQLIMNILGHIYKMGTNILPTHQFTSQYDNWNILNIFRLNQSVDKRIGQ